MEQKEFRKLAVAWSKDYPHRIIKCTTNTGMPAHAFIYVHNPETYYSVDDDKLLIDVLREYKQKEEIKMPNGYESLPKVWAWDNKPNEAIECVFLSNDNSKKYSNRVLNDDTIMWFENVSVTKPQPQPIKNIISADDLNDIYHKAGKDFRIRDNSNDYIYYCFDYPTNQDFDDFQYSIDRGVTWIDCNK
jgi:hypothetical protein